MKKPTNADATPETEGFDFGMYTSTVEKALDFQNKIVKGMEVLANLDYDETNKTPRDLVFQMDKMKLYHYKPMVKSPNSIPVLIVYALMNKEYIMDIQQNKSFVKKLLELGLDLYIVDWGYATPEDRYNTMEDYVEGYMGAAVDFILRSINQPQINLLGKCQGGTFAAMYASLHPEKIKNLVTIAAPFDFDVEDGLLFKWAKYMNIDSLVDGYGMIPGDFLNISFIMLNPYNLAVDKYINMVDNLDDPESLGEFLRMEKWLFDSPAQAGENYRTWMKDLWQENKLIKNEFYLGDQKINLKNITMPLLNIYGDKDNLIPASASMPLNQAVGSKDQQSISYPVGHAGIVASNRSQREIAPKVAEWLKERSK